MKKILLTLTCLLLVACLAPASVMADDAGFKPTVTITENTEQTEITVVIEDESGILQSQKPTLTVPCTYDKAVVYFGTKKIQSLLTNEGTIAFQVGAPGTYVIKKGEDKSSPVIGPSSDNSGSTVTVTPKPAEPTKEEYAKAASEKFKDIPETHNFAPAIGWAVAKEITFGITETEFGAGGTCTRAQMMAFLFRAAGKPESTLDTSKFKDVNASSYYAKAVAWAIENKITFGTSGSAFSPNKTLTRWEVVKFLERFLGKEIEFDKSVDLSLPCTRGMAVEFLYRYFGE